MRLAEVLQGKRAGDIQKCGIMSIIPIFYQDEDLICHGIATPRQALNVQRNSTYGEMRFKNDNQEKMLIVPNNIGVISKETAQDHAMCKTGLVKPGSSVQYNDAFCIEQTQGGMLKGGSYEFIVLPYALRGKAHMAKGATDYSRFWPEIKKFNAEFGISGNSHLVYFYDRFKDQLGDFVAQFENLPDQVGAIVMIDKKIVGVEVAPNPEYWKDVWKPLIRDCYGTEVIRRLLQGTSTVKPLVDQNITQATCISDLMVAIDGFEKDLRDKTEAIIANVADQKMDISEDQSMSFRQNNNGVVSEKRYKVYDVSNKSYIGQVVKEDDFVCYASITANAGKVLAKSGFAF